MFLSELALLLCLEMFLQCLLASKARISLSLAPSQVLAALHTALPSVWDGGSVGAPVQLRAAGLPLLLLCRLGVSRAVRMGGLGASST